MSSIDNGTEKPRIVDKRASARADSLYEGMSNEERQKLYAKSRRQVRTHHFPLNENPHDPEATPDSGYEYVKLEVTEGEDDRDKYAGLTGPDSGVTCFDCRRHHFLIVDERTREQIIESRPELKWAVARNRDVDEVDAPNLLLLFCPGCKALAQLRELIVALLRSQEEARHGS